MSTQTPDTPQPEAEADESMNITIRLPKELAEFVEELAAAQFNTRAGIVRMAVFNLKQAVKAGDKPELAKAS